MPAAIKCRVCPNLTEDDGDLCPPCSVELAYRIMAAEPNPSTRRCEACSAPFLFTEARVLRSVKNPGVGNQFTPGLCWVCAHLHYSAASSDPTHEFSAIAREMVL